jgi:broad specificity phosphatase PhoE
MGSLILVRHSLTESSENGRNLGQRSDPPLLPAGLDRARSAASAIAAELATLSHDELRLISSPALRCRQTAEPIGAALRLEPASIEAQPDLREIDYGDWEGLTADECHHRDPELRQAWELDPYATRCPAGESGSDVAARAFPALDTIEDWLAAGQDRAAVVVSHNHVIRLWLTKVLGLPLAEYRSRLRVDPAAYNIVTLGARRPSVRRLNAGTAQVGPG